MTSRQHQTFSTSHTPNPEHPLRPATLGWGSGSEIRAMGSRVKSVLNGDQSS